MHRRGISLGALCTALLFAGFATGCATSRSCGEGNDAHDVACRTARARQNLEFGMNRQTALDLLGTARAQPPWPALGDAPEHLDNPYDSQEYESKIGEQYEVVRHFTYVERVSKCPFLQGRVELEPLVFFEQKLVGWNWAYVADLVDRRIRNDEKFVGFGVFCDRVNATEPELE